MSGRNGQGPLASSERTIARRRWLPFWVLQAIEVMVALIFVDISVHVSRGGLLVAAAIALAGLAVTARGPLGILRICGQRLHLILVVAAAAVVAIAPVIPAVRPDIQGIIVLEFGAIGVIRLATFTQTGESSRGVASGRRGAPVIDATARVVHPGERSRAPSGTTPPPRPNRPAGPRSAGSASSGAAARWVGRTAGVAAASGKRAAAKHRPAAEARIKRSIRGAGRIAGRVTSPPANPESPPE